MPSSLTKERLDGIRQIVENIDAVIDMDDCCPQCSSQSIPVNASGTEVERAEDADYWQTQHEPDCVYVALCDLLAEVNGIARMEEEEME